MNEMAKRREVRRCNLARDFLPIFGNGEDAILAATILVIALDYRFPAPISEKNRPHYLAVFPERNWRVAFTDGSADYKGWRRFLTKAEAVAYATDFLARLRGEINRP